MATKLILTTTLQKQTDNNTPKDIAIPQMLFERNEGVDIEDFVLIAPQVAQAIDISKFDGLTFVSVYAAFEDADNTVTPKIKAGDLTNFEVMFNNNNLWIPITNGFAGGFSSLSALHVRTPAGETRRIHYYYSIGSKLAPI